MAQGEVGEMDGLDWFLCVVLSGIGLLAGLFALVRGKSKGSKMIGVSIVSMVAWKFLITALQIGKVSR